LSEAVKQVSLLDGLDENIKRVKTLSKTSRRIESIEITPAASTSKGLKSIKLSTSVLTEGLVEKDIEFLEVEFKGALLALSSKLDDRAKFLIKEQAENF
jgi:hypothetical protein